MLSDRNRLTVGNVLHRVITEDEKLSGDAEWLNAIMDAARSEARAEAEERMKRVVEALRPFAEACAHLHPLHPDDGETLDGFKVSDFRRAAEVYAALSQEGDGK